MSLSTGGHAPSARSLLSQDGSALGVSASGGAGSVQEEAVRSHQVTLACLRVYVCVLVSLFAYACIRIPTR